MSAPAAGLSDRLAETALTASPAVRAETVSVARQTLATHAKTFQFASVLLSASQRDDAAVVYAFCRAADDAVDERRTISDARDELDQMRGELLGSRPASPLVGAYLDVCERRGIPVVAAEQLLLGVESDLDVVRFASDRDLVRYSYRVAGTVGLMMCGVIGVNDPEATPFALDLGIAMQITNICRDVLEDAQRGRMYVPTERLEEQGVDVNQVLAGKSSDGLREVVRQLLFVAEEYYASADAGMRYIPRRPRMAIAAASRIYRAIGLALRDQRYDPMLGRAYVPKWKKARWLLGSIPWALVTAPRINEIHRAILHQHLVGLPLANPR